MMHPTFYFCFLLFFGLVLHFSCLLHSWLLKGWSEESSRSFLSFIWKNSHALLCFFCSVFFTGPTPKKLFKSIKVMPKQGTSTGYHQLLSRGAVQNPCRRLEKQWKTEGGKSCTTMNKGPRDGVEPGEGFSCPSSFLRLGDWEERSVRGAARLCPR